MSEKPIQWVYVAGSECAYCKDGLCGRFMQLLEEDHERTAREVSRIMEAECENKWKASTIRNIWLNEVAGNQATITPEQGGLKLSLSVEWYTPAKYINAVKEVLGEIDLDPASSARANKTIQAKKIHTKADNGLEQEWHGRVFLNPPYGKLGPKFVAKLIEELKAGRTTESILLVNAYATDTSWFEPLYDGLLCFTNHRIDFDSPNPNENSSTHGSCFVYFGKQGPKFAQVFSEFGTILSRYVHR